MATLPLIDAVPLPLVCPLPFVCRLAPLQTAIFVRLCPPRASALIRKPYLFPPMQELRQPHAFVARKAERGAAAAVASEKERERKQSSGLVVRQKLSLSLALLALKKKMNSTLTQLFFFFFFYSRNNAPSVLPPALASSPATTSPEEALPFPLPPTLHALAAPATAA